MKTEELLNFSCEIGKQLMMNGAEIYRVEESIERILQAYGYEQREVFAIPSCIIINIQDQDRNYTKAVRIKTTSNNLHKLGTLNSLCREICRDRPEMEKNIQQLQEILDEPRYPELIGYLASAVGAFFFTLFWGGTWRAAIIAFPCGLIVRATMSFMKRVGANIFFTNVVAGILLALPPLALYYAGLCTHPDKTIIGAVMLLVPGIAITNVMRDVLAGDFLTAMSRFSEVLIVGIGASIGVAIAITGARFLSGIL